jgi:hypothetical protein
MQLNNHQTFEYYQPQQMNKVLPPYQTLPRTIVFTHPKTDNNNSSNKTFFIPQKIGPEQELYIPKAPLYEMKVQQVPQKNNQNKINNNN